MPETNTHAGTLALVGERLCLDFANTASWHADENPNEWLTSYKELLEWARHAGVLTDDRATVLLDEAEHRPAEADDILKQAVELREAIYRIFRAIARGQSPAEVDLTILNRWLTRAYHNIRLVPKDNRFSLEFQQNEKALDAMLWPIVQSTTDLLTSGKQLERVKQCEGDPCGWLFIDTSRNRSRRWCSMEDCGNRAKARRFYQRKNQST